ncbi:MAG: DUF1127 domain-containing protein [Burkholderiaceae bacterium]
MAYPPKRYPLILLLRLSIVRALWSFYLAAYKPPRVPVRQRLKRRLAWLWIANRVARERRMLAKLSADQLKDAGISRHAARKESRRRFTDIPTNRLHQPGRKRTDKRAPD